MHEQKMIFIRQLRRLHRRETLELVVMRMEGRLSAASLEAFRSAADHRRAEMATGQFYDRVPPSVWRYVR